MCGLKLRGCMGAAPAGHPNTKLKASRAFLARFVSKVPNSFETCGPSIPPRIPPNGPLTSTVWLIFDSAPTGSIRQLKRNLVNGITLVSRAKLRPG